MPLLPRRTHADAVAEAVARRSEIGDLPRVVDPDRKARCEADPVLWIETYCASLLRHRIPPRMQEYVRQIVGHAVNHDGKTEIIVPRGGGKSSLAVGAIAYLIVTGLTRFPVILGATAKLSAQLLQTLYRLLETSQTMLEDYPVPCFPIRCLEGKFQRAAGQTYHGVRTLIHKTAYEFVLPSIEGWPSSGAICIAGGAGGAIRGLLRDDGARPSLVLLDDVSTRKTATPEQARKLEEWIQADVLGLAGADTGLSCIMACTRIKDGDLTTIYEKEHPEFRTIAYKLVEKWPARDDLWKEYMRLYEADLVSGDSSGRTAHQYYLANRPEMDREADVFDSLAYDPRTQASAIERAYQLLVQMGPEAFGAEYQGEVRTSDDALVLTPEEVAKKVNGVPRRTLPPGCLAAVGFIDVGTASKLHYAIIGTGPHRIVGVIDAGVYPEVGGIVRKGMSVDQKDKALAAALVKLGTKLYSTPYRTSDGRTVRLHALWLDRGWKTDTVQLVAASFVRKGYANTLAAKGYDSAHYWTGAKSVVAIGRDCDLRKTLDGRLYAAQNSDAWKEFVQGGLLAEPLTPGSVSLWGNDPREHATLANHLTAEKLSEKINTAKGVVYRWQTSRIGAKNHLLDAVSGACACAAYHKFLEPDAVSSGSITRRPTTAATKRAAKRTLTSRQQRAALLRRMRDGR